MMDGSLQHPPMRSLPYGADQARRLTAVDFSVQGDVDVLRGGEGEYWVLN